MVGQWLVFPTLVLLCLKIVYLSPVDRAVVRWWKGERQHLPQHHSRVWHPLVCQLLPTGFVLFGTRVRNIHPAYIKSQAWQTATVG